MILVAIAGITGIFGTKLRGIIKGPWVYLVHKWAGAGAVIFGVIHFLLR